VQSIRGHSEQQQNNDGKRLRASEVIVLRVQSILYHRAHPQHNSKQSTHLAMSNNMRTIFSASPRHLEDRVEADTLKNVVLHSAATAFASMVLPVEGSQAGL
jgi:hypothetical protein